MREFANDWPDDSDGDVFRTLSNAGFDFSKTQSVDYNVDFESWPPPPAAVKLLQAMFGNLEQYPPDEHGTGYILFQVTGPVTYEGVTSVQRRVSAAMQPFGGNCESWGVMH
jgi:hypothetical protein